MTSSNFFYMLYCTFEIKLKPIDFINRTYVHLHSKRITMLHNGTNKRNYSYYNKRY